MPRKWNKKGKRRGFKPRRWKKKGMSSSKLIVNKALQPFPQRFICKMKYAQDVTTDAVTGTYQMNLNSVYDPDRTGIGHQPYGFDNLAVIYRRYRVISCGWRITTTTGGPIQFGTIPHNNGVAFTNFAELKENPRAKYAVQLSGAEAAVVKGKSYIPSLFGRSKTQYMSDDRYQAEVTANPSELAILNIYAANNVGNFTAAVVNVLLEYTLEFFDINNVVQS